MNRFEQIRRALLWEQVAAQAKAKATRYRDELTQAARAEFEDQGTAPTWRLPELATVTLPVTKETIYVADEAALLQWLKDQPGDQADVIETVERIRPAYLHDLLNIVVTVEDGKVIDDLGTVVPGLGVRPGGQPKALSFRPADDAKRVMALAAERILTDVGKAIGADDA